MKKILITTEQLLGVQKAIKDVKNESEVSEVNVMYNNMNPDILMVRFKEFYTHEDGAVATEIRYVCVDKNGIQADCMTKYGNEFYHMLMDYTIIDLNNPLIQII